MTRNNAPESDLERALTVDQFIEKVRAGLTEMFERKEREKREKAAQ